MIKNRSFLLSLTLPIFSLLLCSTEAAAQVPDTTYRKPELPTGPPVPVEQPQQQRPRPRVQEQPRPQPKPEPEVVAKQEETEEELRFIDKLYFGGSLGLQFGTYTNISLLPTLSYAIRPKLFLGIGAVYHYESGRGYNYNNYGGRGYVQAEMVEIGDGALLAHGEVEQLNVEYPVYNQLGRYSGKQRGDITIPMVGLGYRQRISDKGSFDLLLLYNGNDDAINPYSNPVIRFSLNLPFTSR